MIATGERPVVRVRAVFRRKDEPNEPTQKVEGKIRKQGLELWGMWSDEPDKEFNSLSIKLLNLKTRMFYFVGILASNGFHLISEKNKNKQGVHSMLLGDTISMLLGNTYYCI